MRNGLVLMAGLLVTGCGADGEPVQPVARSAVSISNSGVAVSTSVGVTRGPVTVALGLSR